MTSEIPGIIGGIGKVLSMVWSARAAYLMAQQNYAITRLQWWSQFQQPPGGMPGFPGFPGFPGPLGEEEEEDGPW
ncbi:MAG: hypothetical protein WCF85_17315 [Rhodospirillaceae bacterium]